MHKLRRTHVVWSFETSCLTDALIRTIDPNKVDAIRIVSKHGEMDQVLQICRRIKREVPLAKEKLPLMVDLYDRPRGILIGIEGQKELKFGDVIKISPEKGQGDLIIRTEEWSDLFAVDHSVYLANGMVVCKTRDVKSDHAVLEVVQGGMIYSDCDVQVPATKKQVRIDNIPEDAWKAASDPDIDFLVLPSIEDAADLEKVKRRLEAQPNSPWLLLKVATNATLKNLEELLPFVHGVVVSRVELSMRMDPALVPMVTKEVIQKCNDYAKMSIVASEMLGSMRHNVTPTRAEVSDIANAVFDGADAVVLSEELAYGKFAEKGVALAIKTIEDAESSTEGQGLNWVKKHPEITTEIEAVTYAAYRAAYRNQAKGIVCITKVGNTALHLSSFGVQTPIIAVTLSQDVVRRLRLVRGVVGILLDESPDIEQVFPIINSLMVRKTWLTDGDRYVFVSVSLSSLSKEASNLFTVQQIQ
ncbi:MAG TPA: pyruvate kinase [Oligoflexus sp.]|uniref:pyruvate kinase n=1 Tax=Oligoflexus sp. TaxID=1971216 RepID=UPI002D2B6AE4|nr:pyruvate kinase [Oligoflexus sp.]HYX38308.1 pyruvate kinase [Oligoflexus sp.]